MATMMTEEKPPHSKKARLENGEEALEEFTESAELEATSNGALKTEPVACSDESSDPILPFHKFRTERVLLTDPRSKLMCVLGYFDESQDERAVVVAEKQPLTESSLQSMFSSSTGVKRTFKNDIYSQYVLDCPERGVGEIRVMTVCPATDKHIRKYESQQSRFVVETPEDYEQITRPYAVEQSFSLDWVYNALEGKAETERVFYNDSDSEIGFILTPDMKWDEKELENLYVLAIAQRRGILSLRELRAEHLPLLRNILETGKSEISRKYGVEKDCIRAYVHYQPSYYHLHVHFTHLNFSAPKSSVGEAHLLDDIIDNISTIDSMYYAKRTLSFVLKESSQLWKAFEKKTEQQK